MKFLLLPLAVSIAIGLPFTTLAQESQSSGQEAEVNQSEQQKKFKHDHRKHKGFPTAAKSDDVENAENSEKKEKKKTHNHRKAHK